MNHRDDDLAIPAAIEARLRSVEGSLPPTPAWHPPADEAGLLRVVGVRRASRGPSIAAVLVAVSVLVGAVLLAGRASAPPVVSGPASASASASDAAAATAGASASGAAAVTAGPLSNEPAIAVLRGAGDGDHLIARESGCREFVGSEGLMALLVDGVMIDRAATAAGTDGGWLDVPVDGRAPVRVWLGEDPVGLARGLDSLRVAIGGRGDMWVAEGSRATRWIPLVTPAGRTYWLRTPNSIEPAGSCPAATPTPPPILGVRSFTCGSLDVADCLAAIDAARRVAPDAFGPTVDVVTGPTCPPWARCVAPIDGPRLIVVTIPAVWNGPDDLRAFVVGPFTSGMPVQARGIPVPDHMLTDASRPSLSLPTSPAPAPDALVFCNAARLEGGLHGSPWDPRVAWVGTTAIRWPHRFTARFVPDLELVGPDHSVVAREGDAMVLGGGVGMEGNEFGACSINGTTYPLP